MFEFVPVVFKIAFALLIFAIVVSLAVQLLWALRLGWFTMLEMPKSWREVRNQRPKPCPQIFDGWFLTVVWLLIPYTLFVTAHINFPFALGTALALLAFYITERHRAKQKYLRTHSASAVQPGQLSR